MLVLEEIFKMNKPKQSQHFNLRIHRSMSWLNKADDLVDDLDLQFLSLWIAFHAIYAKELDIAKDESDLKAFLQQIFDRDDFHKLHTLIWDRLSQPIKFILDSPFLHQSLWEYQNQKISQHLYKEQVIQEKLQATEAIENKDVVSMLYILIYRLHTLRNQLLHGGLSYQSCINRQLLKSSIRLLLLLLPMFVQILIENAAHFDTGLPYYPVLQLH